MKDKLLEMLNKLEKTNDVDFFDGEDTLFITFNDFEGFDKDWEEIDRNYGNEELVYQVLDFLKNNCKSQKEGLYNKLL